MEPTMEPTSDPTAEPTVEPTSPPTLATVDNTVVCMDFNNLQAGTYVSDLGDFTIETKGDGAFTDFGARVYNTNDDNIDGLDPDLIVNQGNALIIQQAGFVEPNDNGSGGALLFSFRYPVIFVSLTLIDTKAFVIAKRGGQFGMTVGQTTTPDLSDNEFAKSYLDPEGPADYLRIKFPQSGALSELCYSYAYE